MLVRKTDPATTTPVQMDGVKDVTMQVMVGSADGAPNFATRHFVVQPGGHSPHHSHDYEHEVYVIEGEADAECDGEVERVHAGDVLYVPANATHQFRNTSNGVFRFLCLVPVTFDCGTQVPGS
jgi:quercetin dioxygenase-like cupin family protein